MTKRGDHDLAATKVGPKPPRGGKGSSGSWRDPDIDTTHDFKKRGDHDAAGTKVGHAHPAPPLLRRRRANGNIKPMRFVSLHHHSTFSYLDGYQLPEAHVRRAEELQMGAFALTEHGNIDSHVKLETAAEGSGVKPIFGCEVYMPAAPLDARDDDLKTQSKYHLTVIAKTAEGYRNLLALVSQSYQDFYYEPTVTWASLLKYRRGLVILSGCQGSLLFCSTVGGKKIEPEDASYRRGLAVARRFKRAFGSDYLIEVQAFPELEKSREFNGRFAGKLARAVRTRLVATMDCHYTALEESEVQQILHNLRPGEKRSIEEQAREWGYEAPLCPPANDGTIYRRLRASGLSKSEAIEAIVSTEELAQDIEVELPKLPMVRFPVPDGYDDAIAYWRALLKQGWRYRRFHRLPADKRRRAKAQLKHEMELIESKDFVDYFLLVRAGVVFIKEQGIPVGPARGSAAASLAAYLLRVTEVNPLEFPLLRFERFIDVTRQDLPDIDLDFPSEARPMLRDFYSAMLGDGCVNNIGTFTFFKNRLAIDDVARVFRVPKFEVATVKDFLIERSSGDLRASSTIEDTVEQFPQAAEVFDKYPELRKAQLIEGNVKAFGIHAAGLVLSNEPITSVTAVLERTIKGNVIQAVSMDKDDAERQGLVKMDFLGLSTMSMLWEASRELGWSLDYLYNQPLDDEEVYKGFKENDVIGVFQFDGRTMQQVCGALAPEKFSEIMDCNALARPGPLHNGAVREYADIKHGSKVPQRTHPAIDAITEPTQFQIVYQEQILQIVREVGGFDDTGVATIRRIIAKKYGEQAFSRRKREFIDGAATLAERSDWPAIPAPVAEAAWGNMITSGAYAFNAAHCAAYGLIAVWTMRLKRRWPAVFYAASLAHTKSEERKHQLLRDAARHEVQVRPPHPSRSTRSWKRVPKRRAIRAGFADIKGIGDKTAEAILDYRENNEVSGWRDFGAVRGIGPKTLDQIEEFVAKHDPFNAFKLSEDIIKAKEMIAAGKLGDLPEPTHTARELPFERGVEFGAVWLGTILARNVRDIFETNRARTGEELDAADVRDPHLNEWALLKAEDETDQLLLKVDRWAYPKFKRALFDFKLGSDLALVRGLRPRHTSYRQIKVKDLVVIEP